MKKWFPSIFAAAASLFTIFTPIIQGAVASHPAIAVVLASIYAVIAHIMPSPVSDPNPPGSRLIDAAGGIIKQ